MKGLPIAVIAVLFFAANGDAGEMLARDTAEMVSQLTDTEGQRRDVNSGVSAFPAACCGECERIRLCSYLENRDSLQLTAGSFNNPENAPPAEEQQKSSQSTNAGKKTDRPVSTHKVNYFAIDHWPANKNAQVKFQISMKFRILEPNLYVLKYNLFPAYFAYTQKSLWNVGQPSMPFEENNYNPEFFLDYPINAVIIGRFILRNIVISPIEHESNGLAGVESRSWNRQYVLVKFGIESKEKLKVTNSFLSDKALLYVKLWHAYGYSDEDAYLQSIGSSDTFLDYMGHGEIGVSVRNFLWGGSLRDHQLDIRTPIFRDIHKDSCELEFRQQLPDMNFALYLQYWYGYGETLMRFDQFGHRGFVGLSFSY